MRPPYHDHGTARPAAACWLALAFACLLPAVAAGDVPLLDPEDQPQFVRPLPLPGVMQPTMPSGSHYEVSVSQFDQWLGLVDPSTGDPLMTTVWGYNGTYPGATFEARRDDPITVRWTNYLVETDGDPLPHLLPVDTSLHWATPDQWPYSGVPVVTHLHGGHSESPSDGLPEAWFTPDFAQKGGDWVQETYHYDNDQQPTTLWYHDHALGITRLNVYAGLAGFYLLRDDWEESLNLPSGDYEVPIAIQDRMFTTDGQLFFPSEPEEEGAPEPSVLPEFFGDFILVNGAAWPYLDVEPRKYRFRLLNGSDSRFYSLRITSEDNPMGPPVWQIGTDEGLLYAPVMLNQLVLGPGERADLVVDFTDWAGHTLMLRNNARTPFPDGETIDPNTVGQILQFRVSPNPVEDPSALPAVLRSEPIALPGTPTRIRRLLLFEGTDVYGRLQPLLGIVDPFSPDNGTLAWDDGITENPMLDDVEVWEIFNATEDAHPIHLHLVSFQILSRQKFRGTLTPKPMGEGTIGGILSAIRLRGRPRPPAPNENGWKDTAQMFPGEVTRVIARFDRAGKYVWHCYILSHEDHEMMRPYEVLNQLSKATSSDNPAIASAMAMVEVAPLAGGAIRFELPAPGLVAATIFDVQGRFVRRLGGAVHTAGPNRLLWDGRSNAGAVLPNGIYFYRVSAPGFTQEGKVLLAR